MLHCFFIPSSLLKPIEVRDATTEPLWRPPRTAEAEIQNVARQLDAVVQWPLEPVRLVDAYTVPASCSEQRTGSMACGQQSFDLPVALSCQARE